jgi:hypothetical protein
LGHLKDLEMSKYQLESKGRIGVIIEVANKKLTLQYLTEAHPTNAYENTSNKYVMENTI